MLSLRMKGRLARCSFAVGNAMYQHRKPIKVMLFLLITIAGFSLQAAGFEDLKKGMASILQILMVICFPLAVGMGIYAGFLFSKGQTMEAKQALIATGIIAAAPIIAYVMYEAMGLGDYAIDIEDGDF